MDGMAAAALVLSLALGGFSAPATLRHLDPATLRPVGAELKLPGAPLGYAWAMRGSRLAVVVKPVATGQPIRLVDLRSMRVTRVLPVGDRDVCGLTYDGPTLIALTADRPCYWKGGRFSVLRFGGTTTTTPVPALDTVWPTNLAFGAGHAYVSYASGVVDAVDLRTGTVVAHWPRRTLAKGEGLVFTRWLGGGLLGAGGTVVDTRTWRKRVADPRALGVAVGGSVLADYGRNGVTLRTRAGRLVRRALPGEDVSDVRIGPRYLYAQVGSAVDVVERATGQRLRVIAVADGPWALLAP
jgi:hypothetical protein